MTDLISIIIPVYNVEKYIRKCLDSVICQTYKNLEIIVVDDGSPDNCGKICDEYAEKDQRIKVIHKENGGLSSARNVGIDAACGRYLCFLDSDDYIIETYVEKLYNAMTETDADIVQCEFIETAGDDAVSIPEDKKISIIDGKAMIGKLYDYYGISAPTVVVWTKLYKKELFEGLRFPVGRIHEDEATTYKLFYKADKIALTSEKLYCYRIAQGSITRSGFSLKKLDFLKAVEERAKFYEESGLMEYYIKDLKIYMITCLKYAQRISDKSIKKQLIQDSHRYYKKIMQAETALKTKIRYTLYRIHPVFLKILKNG